MMGFGKGVLWKHGTPFSFREGGAPMFEKIGKKLAKGAKEVVQESVKNPEGLWKVGGLILELGLFALVIFSGSKGGHAEKDVSPIVTINNYYNKD